MWGSKEEKAEAAAEVLLEEVEVVQVHLQEHQLLQELMEVQVVELEVMVQEL